MSAAHSWLDLANRPTEALPRDALEERIERVLTLTNLGFMATVGRGGPICSPVEFYSENLDVYVYPQPNSPKIKALRRDAADVVRRRQLDGRLGERVRRAAVRRRRAPRARVTGLAARHDGLQVPRLELGGRPPRRPGARRELLRLRPDRITLTEHFLRRSGFAARQFWERDPAAASTRVATV